MANDNPRQTKRLEFQSKLETVPGVKKLYFQRPPTRDMVYPCILYKGEPDIRYWADNQIYMKGTMYTVYYIHTDPDDENVEFLLTLFPYTRYDRQYVSDGLYHDVYNIFYK